MRKALDNETTGRVRACAVFDLDGTLARHYHRRKYLLQDNPNWKSFFEAANFDPLIETVASVFHMVRMSVPIIICTARPEKYREITERWLARKGLFVEQIYMREHDGDVSDVEVKREMIKKIREDEWEPVFIVEDRDDVAEMWREEGFLCLQCARTDFKGFQNLGSWDFSDLE